MKSTLAILSLAAIGVSALSAQNVKTSVDFGIRGTWNPNDDIELDAGDESLDTNTTWPGRFESIFGDITGNTIDRATFADQVATAFAEGRGGVIDFTDATFSSEDYINPNTGLPVSRANAADQFTAGNITVRRGENWWFEGSIGFNVYRGKQVSTFDGTGPSGPDRANFDEVFFVQPGATLGLTTVYDLDFDLADQIVTVGFGYRNWNNFQSQQDASRENAGYPNMHSIATFSNGTDQITQMAVGLSSFPDPDSLNDYFFGFAAPDGYALENLLVYTIGNNNRVFAGINEFGYVQVPEPSIIALMAMGALVLGFVLRRRRS